MSPVRGKCWQICDRPLISFFPVISMCENTGRECRFKNSGGSIKWINAQLNLSPSNVCQFLNNRPSGDLSLPYPGFVILQLHPIQTVEKIYKS